MKEAAIILLGLMIAGFILSIPKNDSDWYLYRNEVRIYEISAEADTLEERAMIFARSSLDAWLYNVNGSECELDPPVPSGSYFISLLNEDLAGKAFQLKGSLDYAIDEAVDYVKSDPAFGGSCREGGIAVHLKGNLEITDQIAPLSAKRSFESAGCQPTAYYLIRRLFLSLQTDSREEIRKAFKNAVTLASAFNQVYLTLNTINKRYRDDLMDKGLRISLNYTWRVEDVREKYDLLGYDVIKGDEGIDKKDWVIMVRVSYDIWGTAIFNLSSTLQDNLAEIIYENKLYRGFSCHRKWVFPVEFHYHAIYHLEREYDSLPYWIRQEIDLKGCYDENKA